MEVSCACRNAARSVGIHNAIRSTSYLDIIRPESISPVLILNHFRQALAVPSLRTRERAVAVNCYHIQNLRIGLVPSANQELARNGLRESWPDWYPEVGKNKQSGPRPRWFWMAPGCRATQRFETPVAVSQGGAEGTDHRAKPSCFSMISRISDGRIPKLFARSKRALRDGLFSPLSNWPM
jgi:hypothetical protein